MKPVNAYLGYDPSRVSRVNEIDSTVHSWESVLFQQGKSVMDFDLNVLQNILRNSIGSLANNIFDGSGFFKTPGFTISNAGILTLPPSCDINLYGRTIKVRGTTNAGLQKSSVYTADTGNFATTAPFGNFFWLEFWYEEITPVTVQNEIVSAGDQQKKTYQVDPYGGEENRNTATNPYNNIIDPIYGAETSRRVQLRWRIRSTKIASRTTNSLGFGPSITTFGGNTEVLARGGRAENVSSYCFYRSSDYPITESIGTSYENSVKNSLVDFSSPRDEYLYIAGRGTANDAKTLNTVDGRVYGIPICMAYHTSANGTWRYDDLSHVVGIRTGSVIAGGSAQIGTHVHLLINEGYDGFDGDTGKRWDRITIATQQDPLLGRPNFPADMYLTTDDKTGNVGYVIPSRVLVQDAGTAALPSLAFYSATSTKNKKTGFSYLEASNTDSLIISVGATSIGRFFKDSTLSQTTKIRLWENSAIAENGLVVSGSIETSLDAFVQRRLIVGYLESNDLTNPGLAGGTGLKIKITGNTIQILNGGSGYHVGDEVVVVNGSTATVATLSSGTKQVSGSLSSATVDTTTTFTFTCDSSSDVAGISNEDRISVVSSAGTISTSAIIKVVAISNDNNLFTISGISNIVGTPNVVLKIETTLGARVGCVGTLSAFSPVVSTGVYVPALKEGTKDKTSRIKQLRTSYIAAEKAILKSGIINGQTDQSGGVDITGNINANARVELRVNSSVFDTTGSTIQNSYPKARSINFKEGPLINLSGEMIDSTDTFNLTISGALDAFNPSYDTFSPKYYFIAGRVYASPPLTAIAVSGIPGDRALSNAPFSLTNTETYAISITVGLLSSTTNDKIVTVSLTSSTTLTSLALIMQDAIKGLGTLSVAGFPSDVSVNGAEIRYSTNTGFSFDTKSSAVWKGITANSSLKGKKFLETIGVETNISVSKARNSSANLYELSFFDDSAKLASIAPGMIVSDVTPATGDTKISYPLQHMTTNFSNLAELKFTCVEGELQAVSEISVAGSGYKVGDVLTINGNAGGIRGSVRVTGVTTTGTPIGAITQATVFSSGSNYPVTLNAFSTTRQNFIEVVSVSTNPSSPTVIVNYSLAGIVTPIDVVFSSSITTTGNEQKTFINSGDRYLSPAAQLIRNDQTAQSNFMKRASLPSDVWVEGRSSIAARRDHRHERERYQDTASAPLPSYISASTGGESLSVSRGDHTHGWPSAIPVGVSFGSPPADTDGSVAGGRRVGTATEFFGLTGPIGKQRDNLIANKSTNPAALQGADALKSALAIWDTDSYNAQIPNTTSEFSGYISAENRAVSGNWLTITSGSTGALVSGSTITVGGSIYEATSNVVIQNINDVQRNYVTIRYPAPDQSSVFVLIPSSQPVPMIAKSPSAATGILPDVGGRIVFGGKVASGLDYAVFGGIRGGKVNATAGDRNGYLSLEARQMEGTSANNESQLRWMTEFLRGYNSGHVVIGAISYGYSYAASADLMAAENLLPTMGTLARKFRVTGKSLFEDGILMNKGKAEFTNIEFSGSPQDALVQIWSTNTTAQPMLSLMQRSVQSTDSPSAPRIYEENNKNEWNTYLTRSTHGSGVGHYSIALNTENTDNFEGIAMQFQRDTIAGSRSGTVNKVIMYPNAQIGSTLNNNAQVKRTLTFQAKNDSINTAGSALGGMNWILSSNVIGGDRNNNYALRSFAVSATPLNIAANQFAELSGGTTQVGKPGQPGTLSPNFQTFVLTDFSNASNLLLYNKRVDFDANVTVNGMELSPTATTTAASFLNTTPQNIFEVYQGTTDKPWRLGTYNKLANLSGNFTASTIGQNNTVLSLTGGTTYNGVYGFLAGQKFTIGLNTYTIQSVDYVAKTITLTASTSLSGPVVVTVEDVSGGLKGQFDRIANEYRLGFITRDNSLWNTGSIEFNDLHFRTGSGASLKSKMYIANNGNVGISDNYFPAISAPLSLLHIHDSGTTSIEPSAAFGTLTLSHALSTGQSSIVFKSAATEDPIKDYGYIKYQSNVGNQVERSRLTIGVGSESRISSGSATNQRKADDVFINASGSIVGQGSGVAGLFAPRVSIPAQSFSLPTGSNMLEVPLNQARALNETNGDTYGITPVKWNRYELIYSDTGTNNLGMTTAVSQWADATISLPWNYTPGAQITARVIWYGDSPNSVFSSARTGTVQWELLIAVITPWVSDAESGTVSAEHSASKAPVSIGTVTSPVKWSTAVGAIFTETKFTWTPDSPASGILLARPGDLLGIRLQRNAGADTFAGNAFVSNLILEFGNALGSYFTD